jgi:hypothetical protein
MKKTSKSIRNERNRQAAAGVSKHLTASIVLDGESYTPAELVTVLTDPTSKADATATAQGAFHAAVAAEQASATKAEAVYEALEKAVINLFKGQAAVLADFGVTEPARKPRTAAEKAAAAAKAKATRAQHKAALAAAPAPTSPATPAPGAASPAAVATTAKS